MTTTYRACYWTSPDGQSDVVLTLPQHASLSDDDLRAEAIGGAESGDLVYYGERVSREDGESRIHHDDLVAGLRIGEWRE